MTELRRALRGFMKCPGFTAVAIVSLALGIGANSVIFSLFNSVALRTLAAPQPERLAGLFTVDAAGTRGKFSYGAFEQIRARQQSFASLFVWTDSALGTFEAEGTVFPGSALLLATALPKPCACARSSLSFKPAIARRPSKIPSLKHHCECGTISMSPAASRRSNSGTAFRSARCPSASATGSQTIHMQSSLFSNPALK